MTGIKNELVEQTSQAFNQVGQLASSTADPEGFQRDAEKPGQFRSLHEACLVVDALGGQARQQQVTVVLRKHPRYWYITWYSEFGGEPSPFPVQRLQTS